MPSGIALILRGKLPFIPRWIKGVGEIRELYRKAYKTKGELRSKKTGDKDRSKSTA
jgi:hypothetical protein